MEKNLGAALYHKLYSSNFYTKSSETQRLFERVAKEFLEEAKKNDQRSQA